MLFEELKSIVGERGWTDDPHELEPHLSEWRGIVCGTTPLMVSPATTEQVSEVVRCVAKHGASLVPQGGNTGLCGGAMPDQSGTQVLLSMSRMNRIRQVSPEDFSMIAEAGCILANIQAAAREVGRFFPISLGAEGSCQIGGNLSTDAGGINVVRYGTARPQVLGLEVVLADGRVLNGLRTLRKDTAGYDLKQLFIGSEGTLGIITAAALRLYPDPGQTATFFAALDTAGQAVALLSHIKERVEDGVQAFELMSDRCRRFLERNIADARFPFDTHYAWYVLCEARSDDGGDLLANSLADAMDAGLVRDAALAKNQAESNRFWHMRHAMSEAQKPEGESLNHDISVPVGRIGEFVEAGDELIARMMPDARLVAFGHVGDGNLHYDVVQPTGADPQAFLRDGEALTVAIYDLAASMGGSFSAEHGVGSTKKAYLERYRGGAEIELMRTLKNALDPQNTLNPGKII